VEHNFPHLGPRSMVLNARRVLLHSGASLILLAIEDVTVREKSLAAARTQSTLIELARDTIIVRSLNGTIRFWNRGAEQMYGWTRNEAVGRDKNELLRPKFSTSFEATQQELLRTGYWEGEVIHTRKDGELRNVLSRWALQGEDVEEPMVLEINTDITERKRHEGSLRVLSTYLMRVQDDERRRIARELHDSTGQKLVALKMSLDLLEEGPDSDPQRKKLVSETIKMVEEATEEIRGLSQLLHPPLLDEIGLVSAMQWLVDGFLGRGGTKVELVADGEIGRLAQNLELALFRVTQEALNNIYRHSEAKKARIELRHVDGVVTLSVSDDGKGLPKNLDLGRPGFGIGILGMKERLRELGGNLDISSDGKGTVVTATVAASPDSKFSVEGAR
jgi:PAS domain S-box-containing protein